MKAKAMVVVEPGRMELEEIEVQAPAPDQILIKTTVTSICSTDVKAYEGHVAVARYPVIMGHEVAGRVVELGAAAAAREGLRVGDRVTIEPYLPCGHCAWCRTEHHYHNCPEVLLFGLSTPCRTPPYLMGGYAEYAFLPPNVIIHKVGPEVPDLAASLSSVVGNGVRWIKTLGRLSFGESLVISGAGSQGLCALAAAKAAGVGPVVMLGLGRDAVRFELARKMGVDHLVNIEEGRVEERVKDLLGGPADAVVETSGIPAAIQAAIGLVRRSGRVVVIGLTGGKETTLKFDDLVWRDVSLICGKGQAGNVGDAMKLINSGAYPFAEINNYHYRLEDLGQGLADTARPPADFIKGAVVFD